MHRVININEILFEDKKLSDFTTYLAHQTLKSEDKLSVEVMGVDALSLQECVKHLTSHRSTQDSERIDSQAILSLVSRLCQSR